MSIVRLRRRYSATYIILSVVGIVLLYHFLYDLRVQSRRDRELKRRLGEPERGGKHIIMIETSCVFSNNVSSYTGLLLNRRQACAIESTVAANPNSTVYLLHTCPIIGKLAESEDFVRELFSQPNFKMWRLVFPEFLRNTPVENWKYINQLWKSYWPLEDANELLRYLSLWKYGGTILDLDFIVMKSFTELGTNFFTMEDENFVGGSVINLNVEGDGHFIATKLLEGMMKSMETNIDQHDGSNLVTKVLSEVCGTAVVKNMGPKNCRGIKILTPEYFFPVHFMDWEDLLNPTSKLSVIKRVKNSFAVHTWNSISKYRQIAVHTKSAYLLLAKHYCPKVLSKRWDNI